MTTDPQQSWFELNNPDDIASFELIKKETKPCPKCGERIQKISDYNS